MLLQCLRYGLRPSSAFFPGVLSLILLLLHLLALAAAVVLLALAARTAWSRRQAPPLPAPPGDPEGDQEEVTVLLPVRDEAQNVLPCLDGLLAQSALPRVRVIDDSSRDGTAELVRARLATFPRLSLLAAGPLPEGWRGKVHALAVGVQGVASPWLLLTDADTRHHPQLLDRALAAAVEHRLDALSLAGSQEVHGLAESLLTPAVFALLDFLLGDWRAAAEGRPPIANGQYILLRRELWESLGGFAMIRWETLDDVAIFALLAAHGHSTGFFRAPGLLTVRMYRGARETTRGWRRNLGEFLRLRPGAVAAILAVLLLPPLLAAAELAAGHPLAAGLLWAAGAAASGAWRASSGHAPAWGLLYPLDALALGEVLAHGVADRRRGKLASWKGREIRI